MTYCAGWKHSNSVYLLADSSVTKLDAPSTPTSSFGESHRQVRNENVEEALLKLVPIGTGSAVAYAGDVQLAAHMIEFLRENIHLAENGSALLGKLAASLGPFDTQRPVELLLAIAVQDKPVELIHWDSINTKASVGANYYQIGSLTSYHASLTPEFLARLINGNVPGERALAITIALVQSYGIHDNLIDQNIGGLIFGLRCTDGAIYWQEDTNFVIHNLDLSAITFASAFSRDDAVVVNSSATNDTRIFMHSANSLSPNEWIEKWRDFIQDKTKSDHYRYWVFIRSPDKCITVVRREDPERAGELVKTTFLGDGKFDLAISEELMNLLRQPLVDLGDGSIPVRLNFRND